MTSTTTAPDQSERAKEVINLMLAIDPEATECTLGRLIAATLHQGPSTALYQFASEGVLDRDAILHELDDTRIPYAFDGWADALARYALYAGGRS